MSSDKVIQVSEDTFARAVLESEAPVLVDFRADWCGPCFRLAPVLEAAAGEHAGRLTIATLDIEQNRTLALRHGVQRIPTLMLFKRGDVVATREGVPSLAQLNDFLLPHLPPHPEESHPCLKPRISPSCSVRIRSSSSS